MTAVISERAFEDAIEATLLRHGPDEILGEPTTVAEEPAPYGDPWTQPGGYHRRRAEDYDRELCLLPKDVVDFILATRQGFGPTGCANDLQLVLVSGFR